jgi:phage shock protein PspC (stress-responsive transcriptional regulator)
MTENSTLPPGGTQAPRPPLVRSLSDRKLAGVAGGLGRYTGFDPLIFRIVFVVLAVFGGSGVLLYGLGWLLVPEEGHTESELQRLIQGRASSRVVAAIVLGVVGLISVGQSFGTGRGFGGLAALVVVGVAAYLVLNSDGRSATAAGTVAPTAPPGAPVAPASGAYGQTPGTAYSAGTAQATQPLPSASTVYSAPPEPPRERSLLGRITVSAALLVAGILVAIGTMTSHDVPAVAVLGSALAVVGVGLVVGAVVGRARGLILLGVLLALATAATAATHDIPLDSGTGERIWRPTTVADISSPYELGIGKGTLDLRGLDLQPGQTIRLRAHVGAGQLRVLVPREMAMTVDAEAGVGVISLPDGTGPDGTRSEAHWTAAGTGTDGAVTLRLKVNFGDVEVRRATS